MSQEKPKYANMIEGLEQLSLGISIVVAVLGKLLLYGPQRWMIIYLLLLTII